MLSKTFFAAAILFLTACNSQQKSSGTDDAAATTEKPAAGTADNSAEKEQLNNQSKACIRLMNSMEEAQNAALAKGDTETAAACKKTIDSAARENVMIGQRLMELK